MKGRFTSVEVRDESSCCLLRGLAEALQRHAVFAEVNAVGFGELFGQEIDDDAVEVLSAEEGVAVERTSKTPLATSRMVISKVPPPRS